MKLVSVVITIYLCTLASTQVIKSGDSNWWKRAVFYQIYPRSFKDSNNDGIGDLNGIIEKLAFLTETGVTAIWLSPIFESPQVDQGYDISDYRKVDPDYGTNEDLDVLIEKAHELGLKVILDFVPNHTSDKHEWFINSENNVEGYEDFYVWADAKTGENGERQPPSNWISAFKNSSWEWSDKRQKYYLHQFAIAQPDLNYRNPAVVQAMQDVLVYWLDQGIDGFRVDAITWLVEDEYLRDEALSGLPGYNDTDPEYLYHNLTYNQPENYEVVYGWRELLDNYTAEKGGDQRIFMVESYGTIEERMLYYGKPDGSQLGAHFPFNFNLILDININSTAQNIVDSITSWLENLPDIYTPNWVLGNHDKHRIATRLGPENVDGFNMLMALLPGIGVTYNGEEIGQENGEVSFEEGKDPSARDPAIFEAISRDFERTPYQWDSSTNAGFNEGAKPWLPVSQKYNETNLDSQNHPKIKSHYNNYKKLLEWRKTHALTDGSLQIEAIEEKVLLLQRIGKDLNITLVFNIGESSESLNLSSHISNADSVVLAVLSDIGSRIGEGWIIDPADLQLEPHNSIMIVAAPK